MLSLLVKDLSLVRVSFIAVRKCFIMLFQAVGQLVWSRVHVRWNVSSLFIYPYHCFYIRAGPGFRLSTTESKPVPSVNWSVIKNLSLARVQKLKAQSQPKAGWAQVRLRVGFMRTPSLFGGIPYSYGNYICWEFPTTSAVYGTFGLVS